MCRAYLNSSWEGREGVYIYLFSEEEVTAFEEIDEDVCAVDEEFICQAYMNSTDILL